MIADDFFQEFDTPIISVNTTPNLHFKLIIGA